MEACLPTSGVAPPSSSCIRAGRVVLFVARIRSRICRVGMSDCIVLIVHTEAGGSTHTYTYLQLHIAVSATVFNMSVSALLMARPQADLAGAHL
jgi:hypothetical protein